MNYSELAKLAPRCFGCRKDKDGTIVLSHRNRLGWGMLFGAKKKSLSLAGAFLCSECHSYIDGLGRKDYDFCEMATQRSLTWAWSSGYLHFNPKGGDADPRLR